MGQRDSYMAELTDEQQRALREVLDTFNGCGLEKLNRDELAALCAYFHLSLLDAESVGYQKGFDAAGLVYSRDLAHAVTESQQLKRAAEAIGATVVDDAALSLDEIFVSHVVH